MSQQTMKPHEHGEDREGGVCMNRRSFLLAGGATVTVVALGAIPGLTAAQGKPQFALRASYPRQKVGTLSALATGKPVNFTYPYPQVQNMLVKMGVPGGGGVGPGSDVVAFNLICPHQGGPLHGTYKPEHQILGACPLHLTTFDLTRHGMVISGHATESLPQIVLETQGNDILAVGVMGLIYGFSRNVVNPRAA
ncbi:MAG: arsenate reductase (azurin) small subunit [Betaproteobacteria bacterium]|nr:arsenate reductase (azurin) small subunit [Betaproteobacteria bacterium]